jgi:malonate-semialdehyde dehydrogenase (acetylating)/methylmalonate-semialdehyde dehydrogenase
MVPLWMFPMALACGNTFILKPSEKDPRLRSAWHEMLKEAGLPDGVFNVVHGDKTCVDAILNHPASMRCRSSARRRSRSTSTRLARRTASACRRWAAPRTTRVVLPDADLEFTADALIGAAYGSAGERCMAISAVVAVGAAADPLVAL